MSDIRKLILDAPDIETKDVHVPEWNTTVHVRGLTSMERDAFEVEGLTEAGPDFKNLRARLCARCIVDDQGQRVFGDEDMVLLGNKSAAALDRIHAVARRLSGISKEDMDELGKGSSGATTNGSGSA